MDKLDKFKEFIKNKPFLQEKVNRNETTWQSLYETYDLFGEDADVFKQVEINENRDSDKPKNENSLFKMLEGVNLDKISENLEGMKKILGVLGEFTKKEDPKINRRSMGHSSRRYDD